MMVKGLRRRNQFAALHFHNPPWVANVVDIMPHPGTDSRYLSVLADFARRIGQIPIVLQKEHHGYVFNDMLRVLLLSALTLVETEVATFEDVDRSWMGVTRMPIGPFGILDSIGIETVRDIALYWSRALSDSQMERNVKYLQRLVDQGRLGQKNGRGFYQYPYPAYQETAFLGATLSGATQEHVVGEPPKILSTENESEEASSNNFRRYILQPVPAPFRSEPPEMSLAGPILILGRNRLGNVLQQMLVSRGANIEMLPEFNNPEEISNWFDSIPEHDLPRQLFLVSAWVDNAEPLPDPVSWSKRRWERLLLPYWVCKHWYARLAQAKAIDSAAICAVTALGGDFGVSGRVSAPEGGAIARLLKAMFLESRANQWLGPAIRIVDVSIGEQPETVASKALEEMDRGRLKSARITPVTEYEQIEVGYLRGQRHIMRLVPNRPAQPTWQPTREGTWVITGGARGITAHVALRLAKQFGLKLHVLGTTPWTEQAWEQCGASELLEQKHRVMIDARAAGKKPNEAWEALSRQIEVRRNMVAYEEQHISAQYHCCHIEDLKRLEELLESIRATSGPIRGIVHGAGIEITGRFDRKSPETVGRTLESKVDGAIALISFTRDDPLEAIVAFGSMSGRFGGVGQTDYAMANEILAKLLVQYRNDLTGTRCVTFHWPAWDEVGMAARPTDRISLMNGQQRFMAPEQAAQFVAEELTAGLPVAEVVIMDGGFLPSGFVLNEETVGPARSGLTKHFV
jgi:NAD(P)-dependent dehydrogenase (short-subunit alcohol dehydrogenase family)